MGNERVSGRRASASQRELVAIARDRSHARARRCAGLKPKPYIAASTAARWPLKETEIRIPQLWNRDREIAQHTLKALHILLVILPVPEIANIARAKLRSPRHLHLFNFSNRSEAAA